jgi:subtilisin family serine protease
MRFDDGVSSPFEGDYPGPEGPDLDARGSSLGRRATIQSVGPGGIEYLRTTYERLRRRRVEAGLAPIELFVRGEAATVILTGQVLLRTADHDEVGPSLEQDGWQRRPLFPPADDAEAERGAPEPSGEPEAGRGCAELEKRLVRLVKAATGAEIEELSRNLRGRGIAVSPEHVAALATPVGKATGAIYPANSVGQGPGPGDESREPRIKVGIIDSGMGPERTDGWLDIVDRAGVLEQLYDGDGLLTRDAGHGNFVAGVVQQAARGLAADITVYKVDLNDAIGSELAVACAMICAVENGEQIVNLSLGTQTIDDLPPLGMQVALEVIAEIEAAREGPDTLFVAAAGNYGDDKRPCYPAAFRRVVAVAGLDKGLMPTAWSSQGFWVDLSAVAEGIRGPYVVGTESTEFDPVAITFDAPDPWGVWIGTSFAAPQVCGALARMCVELEPGQVLTPRTALGRLAAAARPIPGFGRGIEILPGA